MKKYISTFLATPLISGSIVIFLGSQVTNFLQFLFHFFMSRQLNLVSDYGNLATILSTITLFSLVSAAVTPTIVNFASVYFEKDDLAGVEYIFRMFIKITSVIGVSVLIFTIVWANSITKYLQLSDPFYIIGGGCIIALNLILVVGTALLQARLKFTYIALSNFVSAVFKLVGSIAAVMLGFALHGVMGALILASLVSILTIYYPLRDVISKKSHIVELRIKEILSYAIPAAAATLFLTAFTSVDLFLVKHFFSPSIAGEYAGVSLLGKIIYFFSYPIGMVMFPLITRRHASNQSTHDVLLQAIGLVLLPAMFLTIIYFMIPDVLITLLLHKPEYLHVSNLLGFTGIFLTLFSLLSLMTNYFLSTRRVHVWIFLACGVLVQIAGITFYHTSLYQVLMISILCELVCMLVLSGYYVYSIKRK